MPKVTVQFGAPLRYEQVDHPSRERSQEVAEQVFDRVRLMYEALTKSGRSGVLASLRRERGEGAPVPG